MTLICNCKRKGLCVTFVLVIGGNKSIAAKRYVHGIIQIQVREQVLPKLGGLAKPDSYILSPHLLQQEPHPTVSCSLFLTRHTEPR